MHNGLPSIAVAIIVLDGTALLVRRRVPEGDLSWQFPAGAVGCGETPEAAAVREAREEVGLDVVAKTIIGQRTHPTTARDLVYVSCDVASGQATVVDAEELDELVWCSLADIDRYVPAGMYPPVMRYLAERAGGSKPPPDEGGHVPP